MTARVSTSSCNKTLGSEFCPHHGASPAGTVGSSPTQDLNGRRIGPVCCVQVLGCSFLWPCLVCPFGRACLERRAGWYLAVLEVAPQRDGQAPRQGDDAHPAHALAPAAKRRLNHWVNALSGCKRSQPQASSTSNARARLLPALLMPCSIWLSPLA